MKKIVIGLLVVAAIYLAIEQPWESSSTEAQGYYSTNGNSGSQGYRYYETEHKETYTTVCSRCRGSGICSNCGGSGKNDYGGTLEPWGCQQCDKSGNCTWCKGKGYIEIH